MADTTEDDILSILDPELVEKKLRVAFGRNMRDMSFITENLTVGKLIEREFADHKIGPKDGRCLLQGDCVGGQRIAKNMRANYLLIVDVDTGADPELFANTIEDAGVFCILASTHSHMKTVSDFSEDKFVRWCMKRYGNADFVDDTDLLHRAQKFMTEESKYDFAIADNATHAAIRLDDNGGGKKLFVTHPPMPRYRAAFVLDEPYSFETGQQSARINEWKERYAGFCDQLGLPFDRSCVDPSRLMFTPRVANADKKAQSFFYVLPGRTLTLDDMPRLDVSKKHTSAEEDAFSAAAEEVGVKTGASQRIKYATKGMAKFAATHAHAFHPTMFFEHFGVNPRDVNGIKTTYECPNDDSHSNAGDPNDKGFWCIDAENTENGFTMQCSHDSCKTQLGTDRMRFLDKACENLGVTDARDLLQFCPGHEYDNLEDEIAEEVAAKEGGLEELIAALDNKSQPATIQKALKTLVKSKLSDIENERAIAEVSRLTKVSVKTIRKTFTEYARAEEAATSDEGNVVFEEQRPVPDDPSTATTIYSTWGFKDQVNVALGRFTAKNNQDPELFARSEGGYVRLTWRGHNARLDEIYKTNQWMVEISARMDFVKVDDMGIETHVRPFDAVMAHFDGSNKLELPEIERIVNVPVFGADGSLRTEKGYHEASQTYLNPNIAFREVPDGVTEDDVAEALYWINEAIRDFPFSDSFTGRDPLPVRDGSVDDEGFPLPTWERGKSSRANFFAMLLQPFARAMIDGPCPAYLLDKSMPGTGAGFLADVAGYILDGHRMTPQTVSEDKEEFRKEITATLREGAATVFLDNINHKMDHGPFASALTSGNWKGRLLGVSTNIDVPVRATWILAANSGKFSEELMRRIVPIRLDAATPNPSRDRPVSWYKHPDLHGWLDDNREHLVWACHVLIKNWLQAGAPNGTQMMQSFNSWSRTMGGILDCAGLEGFLENIPAYLDNRVDEDDDKGPLLDRLSVHFKIGDEFTTEDAMLAAGDPMNPDRLDPSLGFSTAIKDPRKSLGQYLGAMVGPTHRLEKGTQVQLERRTGKGRKAYYKMVEVVH